MSYIKENKEAWEEAFEHWHPGWGEERNDIREYIDGKFVWKRNRL